MLLMNASGRLWLVVVMVIAGGVVGLGSSSVSAAGTTALSVSPEDGDIGIGEESEFEIVVEDASGGVGAFELNVNLSTAGVATIEGVTVEGDPELERVEIASDGSSVHIAAALMDTDNTGAVTIAVITLSGAADGATEVGISPIALGDEAGNDYTVSDVNNGSLTVGSTGTSTAVDTPTVTVTAHTPTVTATVGSSPTSSSGTHSPTGSSTSNPNAGDATATTETASPTTAFTPGFGFLVAALGILLAAVVAIRRF